jgi:hypothetical protein
MNENINDKSSENAGNHTVQDSKVNLASQLFNKENPIDLNSMMQLATTLLKNEALMSSVTDKIKQKPVSKVPAEHENPEAATLAKNLENISENLFSLSQKLDNIADDLSELKKELKKEKKQNRFTKFLNIFKP